MAGAWVAGQADNLLRGSDTAKLLGIPLVYILNCSGVKLDEQEKAFVVAAIKVKMENDRKKEKEMKSRSKRGKKGR